MNEVRVEFSSGGLSLEGVLTLPGGVGPFPAVIVCHPHPLYGGSMENNVVDGICRALAQASLISFFQASGVRAAVPLPSVETVRLDTPV